MGFISGASCRAMFDITVSILTPKLSITSQDSAWNRKYLGTLGAPGATLRRVDSIKSGLPNGNIMSCWCLSLFFTKPFILNSCHCFQMSEPLFFGSHSHCMAMVAKSSFSLQSRDFKSPRGLKVQLLSQQYEYQEFKFGGKHGHPIEGR